MPHSITLCVLAPGLLVHAHGQNGRTAGGCRRASPPTTKEVRPVRGCHPN